MEKLLTLRITTRPGNIVKIDARDEEQFIELREMYPAHRTESFLRLPSGEIQAVLHPLPNVVRINPKYMGDVYDRVDRESWCSTPGAFPNDFGPRAA